MQSQSLDLQRFRELPDEARVWTHGFEEELDSSAKQKVEQQLAQFLPGWKTHGQPVEGAFQIAYDRFVITAGWARGGISGCSIDSLIANFKLLEARDGLSALNGGLVFYRNRTGQIRAVNHLQFYEVAQSEEIDSSTLVFDTLVQTLGDLRRGKFERVFSESWHARTFPLSKGNDSASVKASRPDFEPPRREDAKDRKGQGSGAQPGRL